ncbi:ABC transporter permease [Fusibacter sp. JL216-2]|uniref:ABC transporter permease n=1 Tax=Fusibacter sp. JL216-2 TaxID=3071453 RepID=UPI003D355030
MKRLWILYKTEMKLALREFSGILFGIMLPVGIILIMGTIFGDKTVEGQTYTQLQRAIGGVITVGLCATGLMGVPLTISGYREKKLLRRFQVSPTSPALLMGVQTLSNFTIAVLSTGVVFLVARMVFAYKMIGSLGDFIGAYVIVGASIYSLGSFIGSVSNSVKTTNLLCTLVYFPMFFLSGATVPYEILPRGLQMFSSIMPLTMGIKLLKGVSLGEPIVNFRLEVIILLGLAILFTVASMKTFRYDYE